MKKFIIATFIFASFGILLALISAILYLIGSDCYGAIGIFSTVISILLGVVSIVYTYFSGKETSALFSQLDQRIAKLDEQIVKIDEQNRTLVSKIQMELSKDNFNQANIDGIRNRNK